MSERLPDLVSAMQRGIDKARERMDHGRNDAGYIVHPEFVPHCALCLLDRAAAQLAVAAAMLPSDVAERVAGDALAWWERLGRWLQPADGDGPVWDDYTRERTPAWVAAARTLSGGSLPPEGRA